MREHHAIDEEIREGPADWTLLKPHLYMQNLLRAADAVRREGRLAAPMGRDRFPLVDTSDVGAAAAVVLGNPAAHAGKAYTLMRYDRRRRGRASKHDSACDHPGGTLGAGGVLRNT